MMSDKVYEPHKSSIGNVDANLIAAGCYGAAIILSFIPFASWIAWAAPLVVYFIEKKSLLIKFHSVQALVLNAIGSLLFLVLFIVRKIVYSAIYPSSYDWTDYWNGTSNYYRDIRTAATVSTIFIIVTYIIPLGLAALQIIAALKAYKYTEFKIPVVGGIAAKISEKLSKVNFGADAAPPAYTPPAQPYQPPTQPYQAPAQPYQPPAQPYQAPAAPVYTPPPPPPAPEATAYTPPPPAPEAPQQTQAPAGAPAVCPSCGTALPPGAAFCGGCGNKIG